MRLSIFIGFLSILFIKDIFSDNKLFFQKSITSCYAITKEIKEVDSQIEKNMKRYWDLTVKIVDLQNKIILEDYSKKRLIKQYEDLINKRQRLNRKIEMLCDKSANLKSSLFNIKVSLKSNF